MVVDIQTSPFRVGHSRPARYNPARGTLKRGGLNLAKNFD
jgi:hypothetical protein